MEGRSKDFTEAESSLACLKATAFSPRDLSELVDENLLEWKSAKSSSLFADGVFSLNSSMASPAPSRESCLKTSYLVDKAGGFCAPSTVLLAKGLGLASSLRASYLSSAFGSDEVELLPKAIKSAKSSCSPTDAGFEYSPKRLNSPKSSAKLQVFVDASAAEAVAEPDDWGLVETDLDVLTAAEKGTGFSTLQFTEENIARSAKLRGVFTCVCLCCAAPEGKAAGKVSFVGGSRGDTLSAVLKSVKPSSAPVDLKSAKLSPERKQCSELKASHGDGLVRCVVS